MFPTAFWTQGLINPTLQLPPVRTDVLGDIFDFTSLVEQFPMAIRNANVASMTLVASIDYTTLPHSGFEFNPRTHLTIPAGQTYLFDVKATVLNKQASLSIAWSVAGGGAGVMPVIQLLSEP